MHSFDRPLVSFTLLGFNQEKFIREAIHGALAQTYFPLEIILSDDCSTDRTFEIMQEMAAHYKGPHEIILNRNVKNVGLGSHVSIMMNRARGELVIRADGDDISLPERTAVLTQAWLKANRPAGIGSSVIAIDEWGKRLDVKCHSISPSGQKAALISPPELIRLFLKEEPLGLLGASAAWSKNNWQLFGKFTEGAKHEDTLLSFRGFLHGGLCVIPQQLVKYRAHQQNLTFDLCKNPPSDSIAHFKSHAFSVAYNERCRYAAYMTIKDDIDIAKKRLGLDPESVNDLEEDIESRINRLAISKEWWKLGLFRRLLFWRCSPYVAWQQRVPSILGVNGFVLIRYVVVQISTLLKVKRWTNSIDQRTNQK